MHDLELRTHPAGGNWCRTMGGVTKVSMGEREKSLKGSHAEGFSSEGGICARKITSSDYEGVMHCSHLEWSHSRSHYNTVITLTRGKQCTEPVPHPRVQHFPPHLLLRPAPRSTLGFVAAPNGRITVVVCRRGDRDSNLRMLRSRSFTCWLCTGPASQSTNQPSSQIFHGWLQAAVADNRCVHPAGRVASDGTESIEIGLSPRSLEEKADKVRQS